MQKRKITAESMLLTIMFLSGIFIVLVSLVEPWIQKDVSKSLTFILAALYGIGIYALIKFTSNLEENTINLMILLGFIMMPIVQIIIVCNMQLIPNVDLNHIYDECIAMLDSTKISNTDYFGLYTNNIPITIIIYWVFKIAKSIGFTNYRITGGIFNVLMIWIAVYFTYLTIRKITTTKITFIVMTLIFTNPIIYAYTSYYYTDTVSIPFLMVGTFLLVSALEEESKRNQVMKYIGAGIVLGFGMKIRVTTIFIAIAFFGFLVIRRQYRNLLNYTISVLCGMGIILILWSGIYNYYVTFDTRDSAIPVGHFLMMGSKGEGTYSKKDVKYTVSFETKEEKREAVLSEWKERIKSNGVVGNTKLVLMKQGIVWGIGKSGYAQYTENVVEETWVYKLMAGEHSIYFASFCQAYNIVIFLLISLGLWAALKKNNDITLLFAIYWGGGLLFYSVWEAHPRHSVSFILLLITMTIPALELAEKRARNFSAEYVSFPEQS